MNRDGLKGLLAELAAEEREERGSDAISEEDLLAYRAGELDDERSQLVTRVLATEPEWARRMLELAQHEEAVAEATVEPEELEREWRALETTLGAPGGKLLTFRQRMARRPMLMAAAVLSVLILSMWLFLPSGAGSLYELELLAVTGGKRSSEQVAATIATEFKTIEIALYLPGRPSTPGQQFHIQLRDSVSDKILFEDYGTATDERWVKFRIERKKLDANVPYEVTLSSDQPLSSDEQLSENPSAFQAKYRFEVRFEGPAT